MPLNVSTQRSSFAQKVSRGGAEYAEEKKSATVRAAENAQRIEHQGNGGNEERSGEAEFAFWTSALWMPREPSPANPSAQVFLRALCAVVVPNLPVTTCGRQSIRNCKIPISVVSVSSVVPAPASLIDACEHAYPHAPGRPCSVPMISRTEVSFSASSAAASSSESREERDGV